MLVDEGLDLLPAGEAVALLRRGGDGPDGGAGDPDKGVVIGVIGLGRQHLVAVLQDAGEDDLQRLAAAVGSQNVVAGDGIAHACVVVPDGLHIALHAGRGGVGQNGLAEALDGVKECLGSLNVRLTDIQVQDLPALCFRFHHIGTEFADWREAAGLDSAGKFHHNSLLETRNQIKNAPDACQGRILSAVPP